MKPQQMWMVKSPAEQLAPYWGIARRRKDMVANLKANPSPHGYKLVKVWVTEERQHAMAHSG